LLAGDPRGYFAGVTISPPFITTATDCSLHAKATDCSLHGDFRNSFRPTANRSPETIRPAPHPTSLHRAACGPLPDVCPGRPPHTSTPDGSSIRRCARCPRPHASIL